MIVIDLFSGHQRSLQIKFKSKSKLKKADFAAKTIKKCLFKKKKNFSKNN